jgi:hypothetical protein
MLALQPLMVVVLKLVKVQVAEEREGPVAVACRRGQSPVACGSEASAGGCERFQEVAAGGHDLRFKLQVSSFKFVAQSGAKVRMFFITEDFNADWKWLPLVELWIWVEMPVR